ncbi:Lsr2 family DNA-binding protein [Curtobacterium sp. L1-20]|uniref:Lsr2 family DNA-binding protein n=1 Tax=Curtobacterium sp. L1-20 TaxID=3138181 RepID=UPI003B516CF7
MTREGRSGLEDVPRFLDVVLGLLGLCASGREAEAFSDYVAAARKVSGSRQARTSGGTAKRGNSDELAKIREWANANGHEVSSRGRTSQAVRDAYDAAH